MYGRQTKGTPMTTQEAINHYGSVKALAEALNIWPHVIYRWGEHPPMARQYEIQVKTRNKLKAEKNDKQA